VTLTHTCHNALADSCGMQGTTLEDRWGGLSTFGEAAVVEMNRLGMAGQPFSSSHYRLTLCPHQMIDLSHTSPATASAALSLSRSPPIFSHSNSRGIYPAVRNIPDSLLRRIGGTAPEPSDGEGGRGWGGNGTVDAVRAGDALISLNFSPPFISESGADVAALAGEYTPASMRSVLMRWSRSCGLYWPTGGEGARRDRQ
jgi:membrane dipeptidase